MGTVQLDANTLLRATVGLEPNAVTVHAGDAVLVGRVAAHPERLSKGDELTLNVHTPNGLWMAVTAKVTQLGGIGSSVSWSAGLSMSLSVVTAVQAEDQPDAVKVTRGNESTGVEGALSDMPLTEILQSMELMGKTARLELRSLEGEVGTLHVLNGAVVDAQFGSLGGRDAFYALVGMMRGTFQMFFGGPVPNVTIQEPTSFLILEAARIQDEAEAAGLKGRPTPVATPVAVPAALPAEWPEGTPDEKAPTNDGSRR